MTRSVARIIHREYIEKAALPDRKEIGAPLFFTAGTSESQRSFRFFNEKAFGFYFFRICFLPLVHTRETVL